MTYSLSKDTEVALRAQPVLITSNGLVTVEMTVRSDSPVTGLTPPASLTVNLTGGASAVQVGPPSPAGPLNLLANVEQTFTYTYDVSSSTTTGSVYFVGAPTALDNSFSSADIAFHLLFAMS